MRQSFEPLLYNAGVDLALYGHVHAVRLTKKWDDRRCDLRLQKMKPAQPCDCMQSSNALCVPNSTPLSLRAGLMPFNYS